MNTQDIAIKFVVLLYIFIIMYNMGYKRGKKVKVEAAEKLRFKFRSDLTKLERELIIKNNDRVSRMHNNLDSEIMKVKLVKKGLGDFVHGRES